MNTNRTFRFRFYLLSVCLFTVTTVGFLYAENQKPLDEVISEIAAARRQNPRAGFDRQEIVRNYDVKAVVAQARSLVQDPNDAVRDFGYTLLTDAGMASDDPAVRQMVVDLRRRKTITYRYLYRSVSDSEVFDSSNRHETFAF